MDEHHFCQRTLEGTIRTWRYPLQVHHAAVANAVPKRVREAIEGRLWRLWAAPMCTPCASTPHPVQVLRWRAEVACVERCGGGATSTPAAAVNMVPVLWLCSMLVR